MSNCCSRLVTVTGGTSGGGGPYTVTENSPAGGQTTVLDTASGNSFVINLNGVVPTHTEITAIDLFATGVLPNEYSVSISWTDSGGTAQVTTDPTPIIILTDSICDADGDTCVTLVEGGADVGGGDKIVFTVDGVEQMSVESGTLHLNNLFVDPAFAVEMSQNTVAAVQAKCLAYGSNFEATYWIDVVTGHAHRGFIDLELSGASFFASYPIAPILPIPVAADVYYNTTDNQAYVFNGTTWELLSEIEVVQSLVALTGVAPDYASLGIDTNTGIGYYVDTAGNWQVSACCGGTTSFQTLAVQPIGGVAGDVYYNTTDNIAYVFDGTNWVPIAVDEVISNAGPLAGASPVGAQYGVDTTTGQTYYVVGGVWAAVPVAAVDLNTTIADRKAAAVGGTGLGSGLTTPQAGPLAPDIGDTHIEIYDDVTLYFTATATNWLAPVVVQNNVGGVETITTLTDQLDGTYIYTSEDATLTTINAAPLVLTTDNTALGVTIGANDHIADITLLSTDLLNAAVLGTDGGVYIPASATGSYITTGDLGGAATITDGDSLAFSRAAPSIVPGFTAVDGALSDGMTYSEYLTSVTWIAAANRLVYKDEAGGINNIDFPAESFLANAEYFPVTNIVLLTMDDGVTTYPLDLSDLEDNLAEVAANTFAANHGFTWTGGDGTVINWKEELTKLSLNIDGVSIDYRDENGLVTTVTPGQSAVTNVIAGNLIATHTAGDGVTIVEIDETITTVTNLNAGNLIGTYTAEGGLTYDIDETITVLDYNVLTNVLTYTDEAGLVKNLTLDSSVITDLIAGNKIATHTAADGTITEIDETITDLTALAAPIVANQAKQNWAYTAEDASVTTVFETLTDLSLNVDGFSFDYRDEDEVVTKITPGLSVVTDLIAGNKIATHTAADGITITEIDETITTLVLTDSQATTAVPKTWTYTSEDATALAFTNNSSINIDDSLAVYATTPPIAFANTLAGDTAIVTHSDGTAYYTYDGAVYVLDVFSAGGGTDLNFLKDDLTGTANRNHDSGTFNYTHTNSGNYSIVSNNVVSHTSVTTSTTATLKNTISAPYTELSASTAGPAQELRFKEDSTNGANFVGFAAPAALTADQIWTLPLSDGNVSEVLTTDGSGQLSWSAGGADTNFAEDNLTQDANRAHNGAGFAYAHTGVSNYDIGATNDINLTATNTATVDAQVIKLDNSSNTANAPLLLFTEAKDNGGQYISFSAPDILAATTNYVLPPADGTVGQVLKTDGAGNLDWVDTTGGVGGATAIPIADWTVGAFNSTIQFTAADLGITATDTIVSIQAFETIGAERFEVQPEFLKYNPATNLVTVTVGAGQQFEGTILVFAV